MTPRLPRRRAWVFAVLAGLSPFSADAFQFDPATMKSRVSYVRLQLDEATQSRIVSSVATTPDPAKFVTPDCGSTHLCSTPPATVDSEPLHCRSYAIYIPAGYDGGAPLPLHLSLHGNGGFAEAQIGDISKGDGTGTTAGDNSGLEGRYNQLADMHGFAVVYPNGIANGGTTVNGRMFNDCRIGEPASTANDIAYFNALLDDVIASLNIDRGRVYAHGYSNGAVMTLRLYQELGERFTAFATTEGNQPLDAQNECKPATAKKPLMLVFGDLDTVVPYYGAGVRNSMRSADDTIAYWTQYLRAQAPTSDDRVLWQQTWTPVADINTADGAPDSRGYTKVFGGGIAGSEGVGATQVYVKKIFQGGHSMSGLTQITSAAGQATLGPKNLDIQLADELYGFFSQFEMKSPSPVAASQTIAAVENQSQGHGVVLGAGDAGFLLAILFMGFGKLIAKNNKQ